MINAQHLTKRYGEIVAVDDLSFTVTEGEVLGLLGPNGAGKTSAMRMLTCFTPATSGSATVAGYDIFTESIRVRQNVGYLPENVPLYHEMRVLEYLIYEAKLKDVPRQERTIRIQEVIEKVGISDVQRRVIGQLSKGYRQRVGLAAAMVHNPKVLILDEPTIGLDPNQVREMRRLIKALGEGHTIILSTHILPEVEMVCKRVIIVNKGKIVAMDTPENLMYRMRGGSSINIEVRGPAHKIKERLEKIQGVSKVILQGDISDNDRSGINRFTIEAERNSDIREEVSKAINGDNGIGAIREMYAERMSLEDVFVHITTSEAGATSN